MAMVMSILDRARGSGRCPPSLITIDRYFTGDGFNEDLMKVLDLNGFYLSSETHIVQAFIMVLQKASMLDKIPAPTDGLRRAALEQRRCIILAIVGGTPSNNPSLSRVLESNYLGYVKVWLDDVLSGAVGGIDLLLHLLNSIAHLPVTKSIIKNTGMGRAVGAIEKHRICKGTPNETAIVERIQRIKDAWNASVKAKKVQVTLNNGTSKPPQSQTAAVSALSLALAPAPAPVPKRTIEQTSTPASKRVKTSEPPPKKTSSSSFSSLLRKVSGASPGGSTSGSSNDKHSKRAAAGSQVPAATKGVAAEKLISRTGSGTDQKISPKKPAKRVKWADHFGGSLEASKILDGDEAFDDGQGADAVSWSDRKKRDRIREKELLASAKKSKLLDDDDVPDLTKTMQPTVSWRKPDALPEQSDATKPQLNSSEVTTQNERIRIVAAARYAYDSAVPNSPAPLTDVEQAMDLNSQSSAVVSSIPFFVPEQLAPAPVEDDKVLYPQTTQPIGVLQPLPQDVSATPEFVQSLGLPMYLVGQSVQALKTLVSTPGLLSTLVDGTGMYDQQRLLDLVQTLSATTDGRTQQSGTTVPGTYDVTSSPYAPAPSVPSNSSRTPTSDSNLHISGYGPTTTEADIIGLFSQYVQVMEVVMKGTFAFVNTSDPVNAQIAKEALSGALLGGMPLRIKAAQRKNRDNTQTPAPAPSTPASSSVSAYGNVAPNGQVPNIQMPMTSHGLTPMEVDAVRDDRGNSATKNLFIAGYGTGTTETQLRQVVGLHAQVIGVVSKGSFSFVNTIDRAAAVHAREMLSGTMLNGGVLRINFAKETGRLGTSFDLTYGPNTGPNAAKPVPPGMAYYGRG